MQEQAVGSCLSAFAWDTCLLCQLGVLQRGQPWGAGRWCTCLLLAARARLPPLDHRKPNLGPPTALQSEESLNKNNLALACRFQSTFLGSRAVVGELGGLLSMQDREGVSVQQALEAHGFATSQAAVEAMRLWGEQVRQGAKGVWPRPASLV